MPDRVTFHWSDGTRRPTPAYPSVIRIERDNVPDDIRSRFGWFRPLWKTTDFPIIAHWRDYWIRVELGFITDLASVPAMLWPIHMMIGSRTDIAAVIHDALYRCAFDLASQLHMTRGEFRRWADEFYRDASRSNGESRLLCRIEYRALRMFGSVRDGITNPEGLVAITCNSSTGCTMVGTQAEMGRSSTTRNRMIEP